MEIIALRTTRYSDSSAILGAYSRQGGRMSFLVPAGGGREATRRRALLMPLGVVECVADIRPGRAIHNMREPRAVLPLSSVRCNPLKNAVASFLAEVLGLVLREGHSDEALWGYVRGAIEALEALPGDKVANFHICFLLRLSRFIGVEPDWESWGDGKLFDLVDAVYRSSAPMHKHYLTPDESRVAYILSRMTFVNMYRFRLNRVQRRQIIDVIMRYYSLHYTGMSGLKSLDVLVSLF
ncbi:MAG: DNA repair protein RecO C-terminal domain-containing protein [Paramuribaculum sp.]|nr:DNA repair protein RecO C-terminal domain-containing protein [Paramuribaculum sp.]